MKKIYLLLLLCCLSLTNFATTYYSNPAGGDPSVLTSWSDNPAGGGTNPSSFFTTTDSFVVQSQMMMTASTWMVYSPVTMIGTGYIWNNRTGGGGGGGGGSAISMYFYANLYMQDNSSINSNTGGGFGGGGVGGGDVNVYLYANFFMIGTSFIDNQSANGNTYIYFANTASTAVTPQFFSATGGSQATSQWAYFKVNTGVYAQLVGNYNTIAPVAGGGGGGGGTSTFPFEVAGTLDCENFSFVGLGGVTVDRGGSFVTANPSGINGSILSTGANSLSTAANYIFDGTTAQVTGTLLPNTITVSGGGGGGGGGGTSIGSVTINNPAGVTLSQSTTFSTSGTTGTKLILTSGTLTLGANNVSMGTASTITGAFSNTTMIVTNGAGQLRKQFTTAASFTYPIGAGGSYTPISLSMSGSAYATGAYAGVTSHNAPQPNNANTTDYLTRYWSIGLSGITSPSYNVTSAQYAVSDVVGTEANISSGKYPGALPWVKYAPTNTVTHSLSATAITNPTVDFSGLTTAGPSLTITPSATICAGSPTVLSVLTSTADGSPTFAWTPTTALSPTTGTSVTASPTATTTYTATVTDGNGFKAFTTTTLTTNPAPGVLTSSSGTGTLCVGQSLTLTDAVTGGTWSSTNSASASVDGAGNVSALTSGAAYINYTVTGGCNVSYAISVVTSADPIGGSSAVCQGATTALTETGAGTWSSSNTALATVDATTGSVHGLAPGNPTVTYTLAPGCTATTVISVNSLPAAITGATTTCAGTTTALTEPTTGGVWSSSSTAVATVSPAGMVLGITAGTSSIVYTIPTGCSRSVTVPIVTPPPAITGATSVCAGLSASLGDPTTGGTWMSGNTALATVNPTTGVVHGVSPGTPTISYFLVAGCSTSIPMVVNPGGTPAVGIAVTPGETVCPGTTASFATTSSSFGGTAPTFKWVKNGIYVATGPSYSFVPADGDVVYNVMHSNFACRSIDSASSTPITMAVTAAVTPVVAITAVSTTAGKGQNDTLIANVTSATTTPHYQWYKGGSAIPGATMSYYIVNSNTLGSATYNCVVTSGDACNATGISNAISVTVSDVSVHQLSATGNELRLAPNPNKGVFTMNLATDNNEQVHVIITNILGEKVKEFTATTNTDTEVNMNAAAGVYLLSASTENGRYVARIVVN